MKAIRYQVEAGPRITMAVNGMVRVCREVGLTAREFEDAALIANHMVHSAAMSADLKGLDVKAEDFGAGEDEDFAVVSGE